MGLESSDWMLSLGLILSEQERLSAGLGLLVVDEERSAIVGAERRKSLAGEWYWLFRQRIAKEPMRTVGLRDMVTILAPPPGGHCSPDLCYLNYDDSLSWPRFLGKRARRGVILCRRELDDACHAGII